MLQIITFVTKITYTTIFDFLVIQPFIVWYNPMYNSVLKTLQLSVSAYLKGNFKNSIPYRHFGIIEICIQCILCTTFFILVGVCFCLSIICQQKSFYVILVIDVYFSFTFNLMSSLCIGAILLQCLSLHNHCFGIHLCISVVCRNHLFIWYFCFSSLCIRGSHLSFRMYLRCEIPLLSHF